MIIRAPRRTKDFLIIDNALARDNRLTLKARGLLVMLLSRPDNWTADSIAAETLEGRGSVLSGLAELRAAGYVKTIKKKDERGRFSTVSCVYGEPTL